jgi:hypothetical protein
VLGEDGSEITRKSAEQGGWEVTSLRVSRLDLPERACQARQGRWASTQVVVRKLEGKHRSVVPTAKRWVSRERLAIQIFKRNSAVQGNWFETEPSFPPDFDRG